MTWRIKGRDFKGDLYEAIADDGKQALDLAADYRARGYDTWIEDAHGRKIDEESLRRHG